MSSPQPKKEAKKTVEEPELANENNLLLDEDFDRDMAKKITNFKSEAPFKVYGIATINGRFHSVSASIDTKGKTIQWKSHYLPEAELEFAQDVLKKVLAHEGVRY